MKVIKQVGNRRLIRHEDKSYGMEDLKGDCFSAEANQDIDAETLKLSEQRFEERVSSQGVWGYEVQEWNPEVGQGWQHVDSIWGFVGDDFNGSGYDTDLLNKLETKIEA